MAKNDLEYYIHPKYDKMPRLLVVIDGVTLDLKGVSATLKTKETPNRPSRDVEVKGATQEVLKALLEDTEKKYGDYSRIIKTRSKGLTNSTTPTKTVE